MSSLDPAFPLYVQDWLVDRGVRRLDRALRATLIDMWCMEWRDGPLPNDIPWLAQECRCPEEDVRQLLDAFFEFTEHDTWVSPRLERERNRRAELRDKRSAAGRKGADAKHGGSNHGGKRQATNVAPAVAPQSATAPASAQQKAGSQSQVQSQSLVRVPTRVQTPEPSQGTPGPAAARGRREDHHHHPDLPVSGSGPPRRTSPSTRGPRLVGEVIDRLLGQEAADG